MTNAHGGPDALGGSRWDFSANANACGPCPSALAAVQQADVRHSPDPAYTALRESLAAFHAVDAARTGAFRSAFPTFEQIRSCQRRSNRIHQEYARIQREHPVAVRH